MTLGGKHSVPSFDQSLEDLRADILTYLIESITEDIIYVAEAKDIRHADNRLAIEKEQLSS
jgi:hypothetical protein